MTIPSYPCFIIVPKLQCFSSTEWSIRPRTWELLSYVDGCESWTLFSRLKTSIFAGRPNASRIGDTSIRSSITGRWQSLASHHHIQTIRAGGAISESVGFWKVLSKHCELSQIKNFMYDCCTILALFSHFMPLCVPSGGLPGRRWKGLVRTERLHCSAAPRLDHKPIGGLQHCNGWTAGRFWFCFPAFRPSDANSGWGFLVPSWMRVWSVQALWWSQTGSAKIDGIQVD